MSVLTDKVLQTIVGKRLVIGGRRGIFFTWSRAIGYNLHWEAAMSTVATDTKQAATKISSGQPNKETREAMAELDAGRGMRLKNLKDLYRELNEND